jgi:pimeloyl-ACP methyl ester carboxylesterase
MADDGDLPPFVFVPGAWLGGWSWRLAGRIRALVYYNAVVPAPGVSMVAENAEYGQVVEAAIAATPDQTVPLPFEAVQAGLMPDEPEALQRLVFGLMLPQPGGYMTGSLDGPAVPELGVATAYLLGEDDHALARPGTEFAARLGVPPRRLPGGHMTLLSRPGVVADALVSLL